MGNPIVERKSLVPAIEMAAADLGGEKGNRLRWSCYRTIWRALDPDYTHADAVFRRKPTLVDRPISEYPVVQKSCRGVHARFMSPVTGDLIVLAPTTHKYFSQRPRNPLGRAAYLGSIETLEVKIDRLGPARHPHLPLGTHNGEPVQGVLRLGPAELLPQQSNDRLQAEIAAFAYGMATFVEVLPISLSLPITSRNLCGLTDTVKF